MSDEDRRARLRAANRRTYAKRQQQRQALRPPPDAEAPATTRTGARVVNPEDRRHRPQLILRTNVSLYLDTVERLRALARRTGLSQVQLADEALRLLEQQYAEACEPIVS